MSDSATIPLGAVARLVRWSHENPDDWKSADFLEIIAAMWTCAGEGAFVVGAPHDKIADCPSWYDGCNCTIENFEGILDSNRKLIEENKQLRSAPSEK